MPRPPLATTVAGLLAWGGCAAPTPTPSEPISPPESPLRPGVEVPDARRLASYEISAHLAAEDHRVTGTLVLHWRNRTTTTVERVPLHLYMNGFRNPETALMRESRGGHRGRKQADQDGWGYVEVHSIARVRAGAPEVALEHAEDPDPSTMQVALDAPVGPGQELDLRIAFTTVLPRVFMRTGYHDDFHAVAQWFPKIGVLDEREGWQAHTFHLYSEFYADFGRYEVDLDVPADMEVGATGVRNRDEVADGRRHLHYSADMVHDFAWVAGRDLVEVTGEHDGILVRQLLPRAQLAHAGPHGQAQAQAFASLERRFGAYPWSTLTIVHVPEQAGGAGGMEYPTLYTTWDAPTIPPGLGWLVEERLGTLTSVHEFAHQYFQGLFASNEYREPWLDEGLANTATALMYEDTYGPDPWVVRLGPWKLHFGDLNRASIRRAPPVAPGLPADGFDPIVGGYGAAVYERTEAGMMTLRGLIGAERFDRAMAEYARRARFAHPRGEDLIAAFEDTLGTSVALDDEGVVGPPVTLDLREYFDDVVHGDAIVDYAVTRIAWQPAMAPGGWIRADDGSLVRADDARETEGETEESDAERSDDGEGIVVIERRGELIVPVQIVIEFADGSRETLRWDGRSRHHKLVWQGRRVAFVHVDPARKLWLESRRLDNTRWAADRRGRDRIDAALAHLAEGVGLALLGGLGP